MARNFNAGYEQREIAAANFNQAANTVLLSFYLPTGGAVRRYGVVAEAAQGLLAASVLKMSYSTDGGATYTDLTTSTLTPGTRARGVPVQRSLNSGTAQSIPANALVAVRVSTDAGAASTGRIWVEIENNVNQPALLPTNGVQVTS